MISVKLSLHHIECGLFLMLQEKEFLMFSKLLFSLRLHNLFFTLEVLLFGWHAALGWGESGKVGQERLKLMGQTWLRGDAGLLKTSGRQGAVLPVPVLNAAWVRCR